MRGDLFPADAIERYPGMSVTKHECSMMEEARRKAKSAYELRRWPTLLSPTEGPSGRGQTQGDGHRVRPTVTSCPAPPHVGSLGTVYILSSSALRSRRCVCTYASGVRRPTTDIPRVRPVFRDQTPAPCTSTNRCSIFEHLDAPARHRLLTLHTSSSHYLLSTSVCAQPPLSAHASDSGTISGRPDRYR